MHHNHGLSSTHEMYLKVLYGLESEHDVGRVRDMAKGLGVTPSTVTAVLKKLERAGLVVHDYYGTVKLTPQGSRVAACVVRRFEIIKALLVDVLGLDADVAEIDACQMEHSVSPATVNRMEALVAWAKASGLAPVRPDRRELMESPCADCAAVGACQATATLVGRG
ncbi:MAG: metal-dependent transcriptional regulator [Phycisphaerales bacterium]|nr:MAG: metal-dependent transcriptional regulator [Phycisphaerales bacterium]